MALSINWKNYDDAYQVWKKYKRENIDRHQALTIINEKYGVRLFFLLYPLYKIVRPFRKLFWRQLIGAPLDTELRPVKKDDVARFP